MPRIPRTKAQSGCYHIVQRGNGKQILYENVGDYEYFLHVLFSHKEKYDYKIHAYCLMNNHFHLLMQTCEDLGVIMKGVNLAYGNYYNKKYERTGHLFQGRFISEVIEDKNAFFNVMRYILQNPEKAGICNTENYKWSSYKDYMMNSGPTDVELLYKLIGGPGNFTDFMKKEQQLNFKDVYGYRRLSDVQAMTIIKEVLGFTSGTQLQSLNREKRDEALKLLRSKGLSIRQLERLTGIGRGIIGRLTGRK